MTELEAIAAALDRPAVDVERVYATYAAVVEPRLAIQYALVTFQAIAQVRRNGAGERYWQQRRRTA